MSNEKIAIVTDSCADVPQELAEQYHMFVLPMRIICQDGEYLDGINFHVEDMYERLKTELPKTSTPSGADIEDTFERIREEGYTHAVALTLSGGLSGTYNHIALKAKDVEGLEIAVYDSREASIGNGAIALQAAEYAAQGMGFSDLKKKVASLIANTKVFFSIDTLEYLQKGGRIGKATALLGSLLDIKPILSFDEDGEIYTPAKVRTHKAVIRHLIQLVYDLKREGIPYNLMIADGGAPEERDVLERQLLEKLPDPRHLFRAKIGAALSAYLGDGLLGAGIQFLDKA